MTLKEEVDLFFDVLAEAALLVLPEPDGTHKKKAIAAPKPRAICFDVCSDLRFAS
jgi:hypothetical protein